MNTRLLRKVAKHISEEPRRLAMSIWRVYQRAGVKEVADASYALACDSHEFAKCGTAACIGGWAELLGNPPQDPGRQSGSELLDIDDEQADRLFYCTDWPERFRLRYRNAKTPRGKASAAVARIEHFIATKGKE